MTAVARCLAEGCQWTPLAGSSLSGVDTAAERHTRAAGHCTVVTTSLYPVEDQP